MCVMWCNGVLLSNGVMSMWLLFLCINNGNINVMIVVVWWPCVCVCDSCYCVWPVCCIVWLCVTLLLLIIHCCWFHSLCCWVDPSYHCIWCTAFRLYHAWFWILNAADGWTSTAAVQRILPGRTRGDGTFCRRCYGRWRATLSSRAACAAWRHACGAAGRACLGVLVKNAQSCGRTVNRAGAWPVTRRLLL